jgi:putative transposase
MLAATCDIPQTTEFQAEDWLGVDLGIVQLAVDSDGKPYSGADVERVRRHQQKRRSGLQKCGTKGAKRRLRKLAGRQARFQIVDPRYTSRQCAACGCIDKKSRTNQATFRCVSCGHTANADSNAAINIRSRALVAQGAVMAPEVLAA